jgi:hypothetical protein
MARPTGRCARWAGHRIAGARHEVSNPDKGSSEAGARAHCRETLGRRSREPILAFCPPPVASCGDLLFRISAAIVFVFCRLAHVRLLAAGFHADHVAGFCPPAEVGAGFSLARHRFFVTLPVEKVLNFTLRIVRGKR